MGLVRILQGIGNGNIIWFYIYNLNHLRCRWSIEIGIRIGNVIGFYFSFRNIITSIVIFLIYNRLFK